MLRPFFLIATVLCATVCCRSPKELISPHNEVRIASLSPSTTEILFAIGCGNRMIARDPASNYPKAAQALPALDPFSLSVEAIASYRPTVVVLSHASSAKAAALKRLHIDVVNFDPITMQQIYDSIVSLGQLCGETRSADQLVNRMKQQVHRLMAHPLHQSTKRPRIYVELDGSDPLRPWTAGSGSLVDTTLKIAGADNVAANLQRPYAQINAEYLLRHQPDLILMATDSAYRQQAMALLQSRPGWSVLTAVKKGLVVTHIDADVLTRPGPRIVEGIELLQHAIQSHVIQ